MFKKPDIGATPLKTIKFYFEDEEIWQRVKDYFNSPDDELIDGEILFNRLRLK